MRNRVLPIINFLLILVCGWCIWYLATETYERPREIAQAEEYLNETHQGKGPLATPTPGGVNKVTPSTVTGPASKQMFIPVWTPTPTPTPAPTQTPAPPDLASAVEAWDVMGLDKGKAEFLDRRKPDDGSFELTVGGPPRDTVDRENKPLPVTLISVDMDNNKVVLGYQGQKQEKTMSF